MRYLVVSDVHANAAALEAVMADARWDEVIFLGDAVNYGPEPVAVIDILSELPGVFLEGNHDRKIRRLDPDTDVEMQRDRWARWTRRQLAPTQMEFLRDLEGTQSLDLNGRTVQLHHGDFDAEGIPGFDGRLWPDADAAVFEALRDRYPVSCLLHGHTHVQFELSRAGTTFANPGSVGQPRLGEPEACYGILAENTLTYHATGYDVDRTCAAMDDLPLDEEYLEEWKTAFRTGRLPERVDIRDFTTLTTYAFR